MVENSINTYGRKFVHLGTEVINNDGYYPLGNDFLSGELRHYREMDKSALILADEKNYRLEKITQLITTIFGGLGASEAFNSGFYNYKTSAFLGVAAHALIGLIFSDIRGRAITIVKTLRQS